MGQSSRGCKNRAKKILVNDGLKNASNAAQVMPVSINNAAQNEGLDLIFTHRDKVGKRSPKGKRLKYS